MLQYHDGGVCTKGEEDVSSESQNSEESCPKQQQQEVGAGFLSQWIDLLFSR